MSRSYTFPFASCSVARAAVPVAVCKKGELSVGFSCQVGSRSNVWYGAILKGDLAAISIGTNSSIKDRAIIAPSSAGSVSIGNNVLVGQGAVIGNATLQDSAVIGMGATVGDGAVVEAGAYVAPGSIVDAGATVPAGKVFSGTGVVRDLTAEESTRLAASSEALTQLGAKHAEEAYKGFLEVEQDKTDAKWQMERTLDSDGALGLLEKNPRAQATNHTRTHVRVCTVSLRAGQAGFGPETLDTDAF